MQEYNEKAQEQATVTTEDAETVRKRSDIIRNTPAGYDPVVYWHQVAMDAIKSSEKSHPAIKRAEQERDDARRDLKLFTERLITENARRRSETPLDLTNLIELSRTGAIKLTLNIGIRDGAKNEYEEDDDYDD